MNGYSFSSATLNISFLYLLNMFCVYHVYIAVYMFIEGHKVD